MNIRFYTQNIYSSQITLKTPIKKLLYEYFSAIISDISEKILFRQITGQP